MAGRDRTPLPYLVEDRPYVPGIVFEQVPHRFPPVITHGMHPGAHHRMEGDRGVGLLVAPVLEHVPAVVDPAVERLPPVGTEPGEHGQVVGPGQHVHGVDLQEAHAADDPGEVAGIHAAGGSGVTEALRSEKDPHSLVVGEPGSPVCHQFLGMLRLAQKTG